jgi:hypothetical protein
VYLDFYNISDIEADAFTDLINLSDLYLNNNEIQELPQSTFQHLRMLMKLDVSYNRLRYIHPETFVHINSFYYLNVSHNDLVLNGTILNSDYINILDAAFCNQAKDASWYVLKHPLFSGLPNLTKLVLEGNSIQCVMWDTFSNNWRLGSLDLKNNLLKSMPHQITLCSHVINLDLDLSNNPIGCDCNAKMFKASCANTSVKLDEVSCETPTGLEYLSCDDVFLTDPPDTGICDFDIGSTHAVTSALLYSESTAQDSTTTAAFPETSETAMSSLFSDEQSPNLALNASVENSARILEFSGTPTTEMPSVLDQNQSVASTKALVTNTTVWIVLGVVLVLVVIIVAVAVFVILRVCRRQNFDGSFPATHYFNYRCYNSNPETNSEVNENYRTSGYISLNSLQKHMAPNQDLHYLCRDVTTLTGVSAQDQSETGSCRCSLILETKAATVRAEGDLEEHVYEEVI